MKDLKERTIRGGVAKVFAQATNFTLRVGSLMVLARLLDPKDFGLVGMVTAVTGVLNLFRDFGLSAAAVQRTTVTEEQSSTLFWINILVGTVLSLGLMALSPIVAGFYHEPRLVWVTIVLGTGFLVNAAGVQHSAVLQRQMRFTALATIDIIAVILSTAVGIGSAKAGYGYWSLVAMTLTLTLVSTIGLWFASAWIPGRPRRQVELRSMMKFGGTITLNGLVVYVAYNIEKVLLGRFWGAEALGIYGRAYQLINIPTDNMNSAVGEVAFSALSRVKDDPVRIKSYFLKGYSLVLALTLPITILCALFADDLVFVLLGPKWKAAAPVFRWLAPTIVSFALINPFSWLLFSIGKVGRSLKIALVIAPLVISAIVIGLPFGPKGVAIAYSTAMALWIIPHIAWCVHGTNISVSDVFMAISKPLISSIIAGAIVLALQLNYGHSLSHWTRLITGSSLLLAIYAALLLYVMGQKDVYMGLLRGMKARPALDEKALVTV